jgi:hypothetical protein
MITKMTAEERQAAREKVSSEKPEASEHDLAVEGLRYLRSVRELTRISNQKSVGPKGSLV